eukprot:CAMPEP_0114522838 /NCGR_PEP_ID=MMETSP0109-20121206/20960_1 /TAXON_ID=29199 /ORGANISM="Chlorarachnion reptans, Strain CCCM449" /LENGTH=286 /DNA_ID=CAMNT_0001704091 /DNA_START=166 /DNA_END=1026 /DNA_ORIENTATION=-
MGLVPSEMRRGIGTHLRWERRESLGFRSRRNTIPEYYAGLRRSLRRQFFTATSLEGYDPAQAEMMREECILVDEDDRIRGHASKYETHTLGSVMKGTALHRAFSVFLFDSKGRLLLQKRAKEKITFPETWTNTCCSHPLYREEELEEEDHVGVRRAANRKLNQELGVSSVSPDDLVFLTRILYKAPSDDKWGEHEVDYILFAQKDISEIEDNLNPNEVSEVVHVSQEQLRKILKTRELNGQLVKLTPWFKLIAESELLFDWWDQLNVIMKIKGLPNREDANRIFKF